MGAGLGLWGPKSTNNLAIHRRRLDAENCPTRYTHGTNTINTASARILPSDAHTLKLDAMIDEADVDGSDEIDKEEFVAMMSHVAVGVATFDPW